MTQKNERWVFHQDTEEQSGGENVIRRILAYCDNLMCVENTFEKGAEVIVEGRMEGKTFMAKTLMTKCPSKYEKSNREKA